MISNSRYIIQNIFLLPYFFFFLKKKNLKEITKTTYHEMHECYAVQILEKRGKQKQQRRMVTKSREIGRAHV